MPAITPEVFKKQQLEERYQHLKERGEHLGGRYWSGYNVHLYALDGFFAEVWIKTGINQIYWIEVQTNWEILQEYAEKLNLKDLLKGED